MIKNGNILNCAEDIIIHQVNTQGIMGGGLALQLANKYRNLEQDYREFCRNYNFDYRKLKGKVYIKQCENKYIANIFSQTTNFDTNYQMLEQCLEKVKDFAKTNDLSIAIPYGIGCEIANGDWNIVQKIINKVFSYNEIIIYKL